MSDASQKLNAVSKAESGRSKKRSAIRLEKVLRRVFVGSLIVVVSGSSLFAYRSLLNYRTESRLLALGAQYQWAEVNVRQRRSQDTGALPLVPLLTDMLSMSRAGFSSIILSNGNLEDSELEFLARLQSLESLKLESNRATDRTLGVISKLPDLRYLSLAGNQFSVLGLLQLRDAASLQELEIDTSSLTPIELAVLKSELAGVSLRDSEEPRPVSSRKLSVASDPAA
jgi:hypothetical protein